MSGSTSNWWDIAWITLDTAVPCASSVSVFARERGEHSVHSWFYFARSFLFTRPGVHDTRIPKNYISTHPATSSWELILPFSAKGDGISASSHAKFQQKMRSLIGLYSLQVGKGPSEAVVPLRAQSRNRSRRRVKVQKYALRKT